MEEPHDWDKIARWLAGECTKQERNEIQAWLEADPLRREFLESLKTIWELSGRTSPEWDVERAWSRLSGQLRKASEPAPIASRGREKRWSITAFVRSLTSHYHGQTLRVGVAFLFFAAVLTFLVVQRAHQPAEAERSPMHEVVTEKGQRTRFKLKDGTQIFLNSASLIRFPDKFSHGARELYLQGEAYFEVMPAEGTPFVVHAGDATVEVLGTEFNIKARPDEERLQVVVAGGKVLFRSKRSAVRQQVLLARGQMSHLSGDGTISPARPADVKAQLAWLEGRLVFDNAQFSEVLKDLERQFNVSCTVSDPALLHRHLTASFNDDPIDDLLKIIALTLDVRYERSNGSIIFSPVGPKSAQRAR